MTRGIRLSAALLFAIVSAFLVLYAPQDSAAQTTAPPFSPGGIACAENFDTPAECDGNPAPGAASDIRTKFCIGWNNDCSTKKANPKDSNFGAVVSFLPKDFNVPAGDSIPTGALVGTLSSEATLGLLNGPCSSTIGVSFNFMNASTNPDDFIKPLPVGEADVIKPLAHDESPRNGIPDGVDHYPSFLAAAFDPDFDPGPDGLPFTADDINGGQNPGGQPPLKPRARLQGFTRVAGTWVSLAFLIFEPGTTLQGPGGAAITLNPALGYPSVTILQDPTAPAAQSAITDFCGPLYSATTLFGLTRDNPCTPSSPQGIANCPDQGKSEQVLWERRGYPQLPCETGNSADEDGDGKINDGCPKVGNISEADIPGACDNNTSDEPNGEDSDVNDGCPQVGDVSEGGFIANPQGCSPAGGNEASCVHRQNPASAGTFNFVSFAASQRDADGDGIENGLDVCSLKSNPTWNGRGPDPNDPDQDGLPNDCDPHPDTVSPGTPQSCPAGFTGADEDQDCFANRADNCPLNNQLADPTKPPSPDNLAKPIDSDGDGIGDACDVTSGGNPLFGNSLNGKDKADGAFAALCVTFAVNIGAGASTAPAAAQFNSDPSCALASGSAPVTTTTTTTQQQQQQTTTGVPAGPVTGIGSLAPAAASIPAWAAIASGLGGAGLLGSLGAIASRLRRRRRQ